jgi:hypothetical protein
MRGGGFFDTLSNWGASVSQGANSLWNKTKNATTGLTSSTTPSYTPSTNPSYTPSTTPSYTPSTTSSTGYMGGKTKRRRMRGGFKDNTPLTGLAAHAASFSGETAKPHTIVGGKTRKHHRRHKHSKSCRNKKY